MQQNGVFPHDDSFDNPKIPYIIPSDSPIDLKVAIEKLKEE